MEDKKESDEKVNNKKIIRHTIVVYLTIAVATFTAVVLLYSRTSRLNLWKRP